MSTAKKALKGVTVYDPDKAFDGYTLISPEGSYNAWLINNMGEIVFHWKLDRLPALLARLLPNGNFMYHGLEEMNPQGPKIKIHDANGKVLMDTVMGGGEYLIELDDNSKTVWSYKNPLMSHDFFRMKNGNTMVIAYVIVPEELKNKVKGGIDVGDTPMWSDALLEIDPDGKVVWEWNAHEHLDFEKDVFCPLEHRFEWVHMNTCTVLDDGDILASFRTCNMIARIDHETKKVKWKWGYNEIAHQHEPTLLDNGNILLFDNGEHKWGFGKYTYTRVIEINPETDKIEWEYTEDPPFAFFSGNQGGCQKLPNGNVLICDTMNGRVFEVTEKCEKVWEYVSPFHGPHHGQESNPMIYRAYKYNTEYSGLKGKNLDASKYEWINQIYGPKVLNTEYNIKRSKEILARRRAK